MLLQQYLCHKHVIICLFDLFWHRSHVVLKRPLQFISIIVIDITHNCCYNNSHAKNTACICRNHLINFYFSIVIHAVVTKGLAK